jgi:ribosomal protein S18 acetylase RimI-like enzyme
MIRLATLDDLAVLIALDPVTHFGPERAEYIEHAVRSDTCHVALGDGMIAGYAVFNYSFFNCGFLSLIMIDERCRHRGIATLLIAHLEEICERPKLFTSTNESNAPTRALLAKLGYAHVGTVDGLDEGDPEVFYLKVLTRSAEDAPQPRPR